MAGLFLPGTGAPSACTSAGIRGPTKGVGAIEPLRRAAGALAVALAVSTTTCAQQQTPGASASPAQPAPPNAAELDKRAADCQANRARIQEQMMRLQQTRDPVQRQRLLQEHWATMQSGWS